MGSLLFTTHNLALVRSIVDRVIVLNRGEIVESGLSATSWTAADLQLLLEVLQDQREHKLYTTNPHHGEFS